MTTTTATFQPTADMVRRLQKDGSFSFLEFDGMTREESRAAATALAEAANAYDRKYGVVTNGLTFKALLGAFGYHYAATVRQ